MIVAIGLLPLHRKIAAVLVAFVLLGISLPRVYLGGHYPIDVIASVVLAIASCLAVHSLSRLSRVQALLNWAGTRGLWSEILIFLSSFELGNGFQGTMATISMSRHLSRLF
jgi:membrane-associated phospholipid phosphatase